MAPVDLFGKNVVSTEGGVWRQHRKITSPPFTEKNNHLVWAESLHQAQSMVESWVGIDGARNKTIGKVADDTMRLSLHVISRAGFGVRLLWPGLRIQRQRPIKSGSTRSGTANQYRRPSRAYNELHGCIGVFATQHLVGNAITKVAFRWVHGHAQSSLVIANLCKSPYLSNLPERPMSPISNGINI
jgi:cytochrome P450